MIGINDATSIRYDYSTGLYTKAELARKYHCHPTTVSNVLERTEDKDVYVRTSNPSNLLIMPYMDYIKGLLKNGNVPATSIYYKLLELGACISKSTVQKAVKKIKYELDLSVIRYETTPGQQAQADWAEFPGYKVNVNGIERPVYAFFLVLGYSRTKYVEFVTDMKTTTLIKCMENALHYYGGTPKEILFDNMPQIVNRCLREEGTHKLQRELLPEFTSFADYYGFDIVLARIRRPQEKGKVERFVKYFKDSFMPFLEKRTGHNLDDLNRQALNWCDSVNKRIHTTTGEKPFKRLPLETLTELPPISYYEMNEAQVHLDGAVYFRGRLYYVDSSYSGNTGIIYDLEDTLFIEIEGKVMFLGTRNVPVFIRKRYSQTKQVVHGQKKRKHTSKSLEKWVPKKYTDIDMDWRTRYAG